MKVLGNGVYGYAEAGRLLDQHPNTLRAWFRSRAHRRGPLLASHVNGRPRISFLDLIEAIIVSTLRRRGVTMPTVRSAYTRTAKLLKSAHPFSHQGLYTDGRDIFIDMARAGSEDGLLDAAELQHVFPAIRRHLERVDYDADSRLAASWRIAEGVVIDPRRRFGKPIVERCGISTSILAAAYRANGLDAARVADWYGVAPRDVDQAVAFEQKLGHLAA